MKPTNEMKWPYVPLLSIRYPIDCYHSKVLKCYNVRKYTIFASGHKKITTAFLSHFSIDMVKLTVIILKNDGLLWANTLNKFLICIISWNSFGTSQSYMTISDIVKNISNT